MKKLSPFGAATLVWAAFMIALVLYITSAPIPPKADYHKTRIEPRARMIIVTQTVEVKEEPYYSDIANNITAEEIDLLAKIIYLEAGNQSVTGQRAVAEVVFNRMLDERFPDTLREVIFAPGQFATVKNITAAKPSDEQYTAIDEALTETVPILPRSVVYFATSVVNGTKYEKIGNHYFCY